MIRNTTADMQDPNGADALMFLAHGLTTGSPAGFIEAQEKAGQRQLVHSDRLPTDLNGDSQADFEALGFTFGDPDPADPMFRPATLPDGWSRQSSDHAMWSYIVDQLGRRRVGVFYKAAFYDRSAHMNLTSVYSYLSECRYDGKDVVPDDAWATPVAIVAAAKQLIDRCEERIAVYTRPDVVERDADYASERVAKSTAERDHFAALAAHFDNGEVAA